MLAAFVANENGVQVLFHLFLTVSSHLSPEYDLVLRTLLYVEESESGQIHLQDALPVPCC